MFEVTIPLRSHDEAVLILGPFDRYAKLLRQELDIELYTRMGNLRLKGPQDGVVEAQGRIEHLLGKSRKGRDLGLKEIETILLRQGSPEQDGQARQHEPRPSRARNHSFQRRVGNFKVRAVEPRNENQRRYLDLIEKNPLVFSLGSAGTGKTYMAVNAAVRLLRQGLVRKLIVTRPVVEAGEHLGFLPGDLQQKLNPYMRPIYDALYDIVDADDVARLEEAAVIEVAPLAYMRGRTLTNAFVILDEAQNTTVSQMKMFLTRMGEDSIMVVTGDPSQNDLPPHVKSGLTDAVMRLRGYANIGFVEFTPQDVVRHPLVAQIIRAYQVPPRKDAREGARSGEDDAVLE